MPNEIRLYHNPRCSKSRAALQWLQNSGAEFEVVDYQKNPPDAETLSQILQRLNLRASELLRRGEAQFKSLKANVDKCSESEVIDLMVQYPILIERPIVVTADGAAIGRPLENVIELLDDD
jgi:arsenate reductase